MKRLVILGAAFLLAFAVAAPLSAAGRPLSATLSGDNEVPGPGDFDGSGSALVTLNPGAGKVCFDIEVADVDPIAAAHIHEGPAGVAGGVVVDFDVPANGLNGCVEGIAKALVNAIRNNPAAYYVNVHNAAFPAGALRGQLEPSPGTRVSPPSNRPAQVPGNPMYLALGDSWAWGQGATPGTESVNGYVGQLFVALRDALDCLPSGSPQPADGCRHLQLLNLARHGRGALPGVTSFHVITEQLPVAIPLLEARNGDANPRNDVEVITLHVGGNDVAGPIRRACLGGFSFDCVVAWLTEMGTFEAELEAVVSGLRAAAGPDTPIVLGTYDNPVPTCDLSLPPPDGFGPLAILLGEFVLEGVPAALVPPDGLDGVHTVIRRVAGPHGAEVADVFGTFDPADFVGGADCLHPTNTGHDKVTDAFLALLGG